MTEKLNHFSILLNIGYIDFEKAFVSTDYEAILKALRTIGLNEIYVTILEDIYTGKSSLCRIPILKGVRQGVTMSGSL